MFDKNKLIVYAITDESLSENELYSKSEDVLKSGIKCLQFRDKKLSQDDFLKRAIVLRNLCKKYNAMFIINDRVEIAIECKADGIHVGQKDMEAKTVRNMIKKSMILGVSCENLEQAILAKQVGADYLGIGAIFNTNSKRDASSVSLEVLTKICEKVDIPIVAIGGINEKNMVLLKNIKLAGFAMIHTIFSANDIKIQCQKLLLIAKKTLGVDNI